MRYLKQQLLSATAHGAGRLMSRTRAKQELSESAVRQYLLDHGVVFQGGGVHEAPMAYKNIHAVMPSQQELVAGLGSFTPKSCAWMARRI
ncbi:RtcB family protein [Hymenobacter elongatus]|uniref:3'-phosphate/5'-hydroxy nucleic acid ligase n=1 Tax=Hymenobacter elongatus TaxID=877208 RepID=A0A4Z0PNX5_9BACT|nr:RtcB family protein [Hymenobacter elongatus]TGE18961.1 hypothetical protein E5J99_04250 [Hymenobacter elongatus]